MKQNVADQKNIFWLDMVIYMEAASHKSGRAWPGLDASVSR